ncbi:MAG: LuxR C-terminal-related transcriptional regulator, partial [Nitrososphaera sp.]|nr:LuxR C-terminal-related transcriptional regulator [Nitrososphaera sp.]
MIKLSPQQAAIVEGVFKGYTSRKEIAYYIGVEQNTLKTHMERLYDKVGARNLPDVMLWALRNGWDV